jgi:hypothetical protein
MKPIRAAVVLCSVAFLVGAGTDPGVPNGVRTARQQYDAALSKAATEYQRQCRAAADRYIVDLKLGLKLAMRDEKLDDANRLKAEIESVQATNGGGKTDDTLSRFSGIWEVQWTATDSVRYHFNGNTVQCLGPAPWNLTGKSEVVGPNEIMAVLGTYTQRWTIAGSRVFLESWEGKPPTGKPDAIVIGTRPK